MGYHYNGLLNCFSPVHIAVTDFQMATMRGRKGCSKAFVAIISRGRDIKMMNEVMALSTSKVLSKGLQVVVWRSTSCVFPIVQYTTIHIQKYVLLQESRQRKSLYSLTSGSIVPFIFILRAQFLYFIDTVLDQRKTGKCFEK